jgi:hypothetical protein
MAITAASVLTVDYGIQLGAVQPSLAAGRTEGLELFLMYDPSGIFIALEDVGYLMMALGFLSIGVAMETRTRIGSVARWLLIGAGVLVPAVLVAFVARFGSDLQDRFEIVAISIDWSVLLVVGILVGVTARRPHAQQPPPVGDVADVGPRDGSGVERRAVR